jgi:hypothetical protein
MRYLLVLVLLAGCSHAKQAEVAKEVPFTTNQCQALTGAAAKANSANDHNSAALLMMVAKRGGCF